MTEFLPIRPDVKPATVKGAEPRALSDAQRVKARHAAQRLEATFLAEMLKAAGFGEQENSFSGGVGEDQFASLHRQAVADKIAQAGGIGLAEHFLRSMMEAKND